MVPIFGSDGIMDTLNEIRTRFDPFCVMAFLFEVFAGTVMISANFAKSRLRSDLKWRNGV
jgi:hypothetical protein